MRHPCGSDGLAFKYIAVNLEMFFQWKRLYSFIISFHVFQTAGFLLVPRVYKRKIGGRVLLSDPVSVWVVAGTQSTFNGFLTNLRECYGPAQPGVRRSNVKTQILKVETV